MPLSHSQHSPKILESLGCWEAAPQVLPAASFGGPGGRDDAERVTPLARQALSSHLAGHTLLSKALRALRNNS